MRPGRIVAPVIGCLLVTPGLGMLLRGGGLGLAAASPLDDAGFATTTVMVDAPGAATQLGVSNPTRRGGRDDHPHT